MVSEKYALSVGQLGQLLDQLRRAGLEVVGPRIEDGAFTVGPIQGLQDLPRGWTDEQGPAHHRTRSAGAAVFGYAPLPDGFQRYRRPPRERSRTVPRAGGRLRIVDDSPPTPKRALVGMRPCDVAALGVHDRVFAEDAAYHRRRDGHFVVAVACTRAGGTCFCASMGAGPGLRSGFDLGLTELANPTRFVLEIGSEAGAELVRALRLGAATAEDIEAAARGVEAARDTMGRHLDTRDLPGMLRAHKDAPAWDAIGDRCLSCGNCTTVCPTCSCHTVEDRKTVDGSSERVRRWDTCFNADFSRRRGGPARTSVATRYRQWLTHKLDGWHDQFGESGCVGCGRCITWCPTGIDMTEAVSAIRRGPR